MDEVRELDLCLDDAAESWQNQYWSAWQRWTVAWVVLVALAYGGGCMTLMLWATGEPFGVALVVEGVLAHLLTAATVFGQRARRRWQNVYQLRHGEVP